MKNKIKINWNAFWAIVGSLIGAILMTIALMGFGTYSVPWIFTMINDMHNEYGMTMLPVASENVALALAWITFGLTIIPLFCNRKPVRDSIYFIIFTLQLFSTILVIFEFVLTVFNKRGMFMTHDNEVMLILALIGFVIFDVIGESTWICLQNRKAKKLNLIEDNAMITKNFKFLWNGLYVFTISLTVAVLVTVVSYLYGTLSNGKAYDLLLTGSAWVNYDWRGKILTILAVIFSWLAVGCSAFLMFCDRKTIRMPLLTVSIFFVVTSSFLLINAICFDAKAISKFNNYTARNTNYALLKAYLCGALANAVVIIIAVASSAAIVPKYVKAFRTNKTYLKIK